MILSTFRQFPLFMPFCMTETLFQLQGCHRQAFYFYLQKKEGKLPSFPSHLIVTRSLQTRRIYVKAASGFPRHKSAFDIGFVGQPLLKILLGHRLSVQINPALINKLEHKDYFPSSFQLTVLCSSSLHRTPALQHKKADKVQPETICAVLDLFISFDTGTRFVSSTCCQDSNSDEVYSSNIGILL